MRTIRIRPGRDRRSEQCDAERWDGEAWQRCEADAVVRVPWSKAKGLCDDCFVDIQQQLPSGESRRKPTERMPLPEAKWTDVSCLRCDKMFRSWDKRNNRICPACTKSQDQLASPIEEAYVGVAAGREKRLSQMPMLTQPSTRGGV